MKIISAAPGCFVTSFSLGCFVLKRRKRILLWNIAQLPVYPVGTPDSLQLCLASTGENDACELRNGGMDYLGKGVKPLTYSTEVQVGLEWHWEQDEPGRQCHLRRLHGLQSWRRQKGISLYKHLNELAGKSPMCMLVPCFNVINGGCMWETTLQKPRSWDLKPTSRNYMEYLWIFWIYIIGWTWLM